MAAMQKMLWSDETKTHYHHKMLGAESYWGDIFDIFTEGSDASGKLQS